MSQAAATGRRLKDRVVSASAWTTIAFAALQALRLGSNVVIAKFMSPEDFGLAALIASLMAALQMFSDIGVVPSLVRSPRGEDPRLYNTAWTLGVIRGSVLWAASFAVAFPVAQWYDPRLLAMVPTAGFSAVLTALGSTAPVLLNRRVELRAVTVMEIVSIAAGLAVTCAWAWWAPSAWAILGGGLFGVAARTVWSWRLMPEFNNRPGIDRDAARELLSFGRWIFGSTLITFFALQADRLLLGKLIPLEALGIYSISLSLVSMPKDLITKLAAAVQFPVLSACSQGSPELLKTRFSQTRDPMLLLAFWSILAISMGSQALFSLLYDARYAGAWVLCQYLSVPTAIWALSATSDRALLALGESRSLAESNLARALVLAPACILGFHLAGIEGFVGGLTLSAAAGHVVLGLRLRRHGITLLLHDSAWLAGYLFVLALPTIAVHGRFVASGRHRLDIGLAVACVVLLAPLGLAAAAQTRRLLRG